MLTSWQDLPIDSTVATDEVSFDMAIQKDLIRAPDVASGVQAQKRELEGQPGILRKKQSTTISEPAKILTIFRPCRRPALGKHLAADGTRKDGRCGPRLWSDSWVTRPKGA